MSDDRPVRTEKFTVQALRECLGRAALLAVAMSDEQLAEPGHPGTTLLHELYRCLEAHPGHDRAELAASRGREERIAKLEREA